MFSPDQHLVAREILEDHADALPERRLVPLLEVEAVEQDPAAGRAIQAGQQLDQRGLAGAVLADQGQALAGLDVQIDVRQRGRGGVGVDELHVLEADAVARARPRRRACRSSLAPAAPGIRTDSTDTDCPRTGR